MAPLYPVDDARAPASPTSRCQQPLGRLSSGAVPGFVPWELVPDNFCSSARGPRDLFPRPVSRSRSRSGRPCPYSYYGPSPGDGRQGHGHCRPQAPCPWPCPGASPTPPWRRTASPLARTCGRQRPPRRCPAAGRPSP